jgi:tetratricopeptide (TPR) repeat protein
VSLPQFLGRYEVVGLIAHGGMGSLYMARDPRMGRHLAIKLLREGHDSPEIRDRFAREAKSAGSLRHPNIVTIYDIGEHEGMPFIAMEYVPGETFVELIRRKPPLSLTSTLRLTEEVCAGLAHAHDAGIVHRDIKPANLMMSPDGAVKILDFGIAKLNASGMTQPGMVMGTLNYMSPEQVTGSAVDARTDIFAVGAVLYELLTHEQAFPGEIHGGVLHRILNGVPKPLGELCPDIDSRLVGIVAQALEKAPDRRFKDIRVLQTALATVRQTVPADIPHPARGGPTGSDEQTMVISVPGGQLPPKPPRSGSDRANLVKLRAQRIEMHLAAVDRAVTSGDYDAALESCKQALTIDPEDLRAMARLEQVHKAIDERHIQAYVTDARECVAAGALTRASTLMDSAAEVGPGHPDIQAVRDEIARARMDARAEAIREAAAAREREAVEAQLTKERIRATVDEARRRFLDGEHDRAIALLEGANPGSDQLIMATLDELRRARQEIDRRRRIDAERLERRRRVEVLLGEARTSLREHTFEAALDSLSRARAIDPAVPEIAVLTDRVQQAQAAAATAARLKEELTRTLADFEERLRADDLAAAGTLLTTATSLASGSPGVESASQRLKSAIAARAARDAAAARRRESVEKANQAQELFERGDLAGADRLLTLASTLDPENPQVAGLHGQVQDAVRRRAKIEAAERSRRQQQVENAMRDAARHLESGELESAEDEIAGVLRHEPAHAGARQLKTQIDKARRAQEKDAARRQRLVDKTMASAAKYAERRQFRRAMDDLQEVLQIDPDHAGATSLMAQVKEAERHQQRDEQVDALLSQATALDSHERALALLKEAFELSPEDERVRQLVAARQRALAAAAVTQGEGEVGSEGLPSDGAATDTRPAWRSRARPLAIGAVPILLILGLVVIRWRTRPAYPPPTVAPLSQLGDIALPSPPPPVRRPPPVKGTFNLRLSGNYPFEVVYPGGTKAADVVHRLTLPAGTQEIRLKNPEYFLDAAMTVQGQAGESTTRAAPGLAVLTVFSANETCQIAIDGRVAGYHPLTQRVAVGPHQVSIRCPDGTTKSKRITVANGGVDPVKF